MASLKEKATIDQLTASAVVFGYSIKQSRLSHTLHRLHQELCCHKVEGSESGIHSLAAALGKVHFYPLEQKLYANMF